MIMDTKPTQKAEGTKKAKGIENLEFRIELDVDLFKPAAPHTNFSFEDAKDILVNVITILDRMGITMEHFDKHWNLEKSTSGEWQWFPHDPASNHWFIRTEESSLSATLISPVGKFEDLANVLADIEDLCKIVKKAFPSKEKDCTSTRGGRPCFRVMIWTGKEPMKMDHRVRLTTTYMTYEELQNAILKSDTTTRPLPPTISHRNAPI
jgi:hypothetical protein